MNNNDCHVFYIFKNKKKKKKKIQYSERIYKEQILLLIAVHTPRARLDSRDFLELKCFHNRKKGRKRPTD